MTPEQKWMKLLAFMGVLAIIAIVDGMLRTLLELNGIKTSWDWLSWCAGGAAMYAQMKFWPEKD